MTRVLPILFLILLGGLVAIPAAEPAPKPPVRLVVVVFFDQLRGDFLERWQPLFGDDGFKRLQTQGAWYTDCHYPYGTTTTGPGHASVLAGCSGERHGVINNSWYERAEGVEAYCASSDRYRLVPDPEPPVGDVKADVPRRKPKEGGNPTRMLSPNVADVLKNGVPGSKVFGISLKDRSAIFPAGKQPDGAYWFDGRFLTSNYYRDSLPGWVQAFNNSGIADSYFGKDWTHLRNDLDYEKWSGPDDGPGEGTGRKQGKTFPHPTTGGLKTPGQAYYEAVATSPFGNDLLLAFAKACIEAEQLGQDDTPDLLSISFSSNDLVGHAWGPDSQEVLDITLRSDRIMADLLMYLDAKVGAGKYSVILTADHGICPNPEVSAAKGLDAKRIAPQAILTGAEHFLRETFGTPPESQAEKLEKTDTADEAKKDRNLWIEAISPPYVYLNHRLLAAKGIDPELAAKKLAGWVKQQPGFPAAYTKQEILAANGTSDPILAATRKSFHPDRAGDVTIVTKSLWLLSSYNTGTSHGTPHDYDTHTAFLVFGPGVQPGKHTERITPQHATPIASHFLGIAPPKDNEYSVPGSLLTK